jgi:hypothetical protein
LRKSAGKENSLARDVTLEIQDVRDGHGLWSRTFPKEAPQVSLYPQSASLVFSWSVDTAAAKDEIKGSGSLQSRFLAMQDHSGAYLIEIVDAATGNSRGQLLIDTGKGSFRVTRCFAEGDWVLVSDNENEANHLLVRFGTRRQRESCAGRPLHIQAFSRSAGFSTYLIYFATNRASPIQSSI